MAAMGGVLFLFAILMVGLVLVISSIIGLILCKKLGKRNQKKSRLILKILLWILLSAGIVVIAVPMMYFYLIISNW